MTEALRGAALAHHITHIKTQLRTLADLNETPPQDDFEANQLIANFRLQLHNIDMQLFGLYRLLDQPRIPVRATRTPTVDDLEI